MSYRYGMARSHRIARPAGEPRLKPGEEWSRDMVRFLTRDDYSDEELAEIRAWADEALAERDQLAG